MTCRISNNATDNRSPIIRVENVYKSYGDEKVLDGVSLEIYRSHIAAIVGGSGEGKSVLMRIMIGLESPDSGHVYIDDQDIVGLGTKDLNNIRRRFGVLFQDSALFDYLDVGENVAFPLREHLNLKEKEIQELVSRKLDSVGLAGEETKKTAQLSGGMRKRVGLARALALDPEIIFFDEPTTGLDPVTAGQIYELIMETCFEQPVTYVIVTHDVQRVLGFVDDILMLRDGKLVAKATPEEINSDRNHVVRKFMEGGDLHNKFIRTDADPTESA